ncbi:single-stranded-DNA-specific exonuclease RecJ [Planktothrix mougeotii]|uniref:Single-stranded-DNA-specific exonuclease RecJ n=1 Tax=Planktothrix mougeotii LEGE 06226 TaxID=1828728 RepID=A0ABR9UIX5_9CYAN|nr:single-stranded-DNA-specific exonuclease RecJ [Planktothrix mougeotii]MBE9145771.1 single-stranded-DNA-specific exonuclease RecJ [Planktothrix mougeotii LEGE 06226]
MWQIQPSLDVPEWIIPIIQEYAPQSSGQYIAQLLLHRGIKTPQQLVGFLNPQCYQSASPFEFGIEIERAVERLVLARNRQELVTIWGDFDADGITATSVLWDGLGQFFNRENQQLSYYIPNRLIESHGLNCTGIDQLYQQGCQLIVTCDTGSTNLKEIEYAHQLGIDIIVTDHHTLLEERPPVIAIINPRYLSPDHPLYHLSGVAVAYKLVEALYEILPNIPQRPLEDLLDLVAIGLIADLVQLKGDCRYLAQLGIEKLQQQLKNPTRPGVAKLLELCKRTGDRPTDISFGLGPRINAVSRIYGDAKFCVELLTSRDKKRCQQLALETELANTRRKALQQDVTRDVMAKLRKIDLSTTQVIVLSDAQWPGGVLGLVAGQVAQNYGRPTILLTTEGTINLSSYADQLSQNSEFKLARGSARSVNQIDLYELVKSQSHLLHRFGGHPLAAGLSLPVENIPIFTDAINRQMREQVESDLEEIGQRNIQVDLVSTVAELGVDLFQELKLLEPCGMGNPVPKLLIQNCWFTNAWHSLEQDVRGRKVQYIKTTFELWDESTTTGFPGVWWGHYKDELPEGRSDVLVELDFNTFKKQYEIRVLELYSAENQSLISSINFADHPILDYRNQPLDELLSHSGVSQNLLILEDCPTCWEDLQAWFRRAYTQKKPLAIAYTLPELLPPVKIWEQLIGIAKYLSRTHQPVTRQQLRNQLNLGEIPLKIGFESLKGLGFNIEYRDHSFYINRQDLSPLNASSTLPQLIQTFLIAVQEEQFRRQYFCNVPVSTLEYFAIQTLKNIGVEA